MFQIPFFIRDFPDHEKHKYKILSLITQNENSSLYEEKVERISLNYWKLKDIKKKTYAEYVLKVLDNDLKSLFKSMEYDMIRYQGIWFQQYEKADFHSWHRHGNSEWNLVYYLEFDKKCPATEFRNPLNKDETYIPNVHEGQYVLFPSLLSHRSVPNESRSRKTVIAINIVTNIPF